MAIELISTIVAKNNGNFAIALSNEIKGGIHSKKTIDEMNSISKDRLQEGMLCWITGLQKYYQWNGVSWVEFSISGNNDTSTPMYRVDTYEDMEEIYKIDLKEGSLCHVKDDVYGNYLYYFHGNKWCTIGSKYQVWIGVDEPPDKNYLWVDTRNMVSGEDITIDNLPTFIDTPLVQYFVNQVNALTQRIIYLEEQLEEILKGNIDIGGGDSGNDEEESVEDRLLTEEGDYLVTEDGSYFILENSQKDEDKEDDNVKGTQLITEDGKGFITEDGQYIITEDS